MTREEFLKRPQFIELVLSVGELIDSADKSLDVGDSDRAESLLTQADTRIHSFMFTDFQNYSFLSTDQYLCGVMVNLTQELTATLADL